MSLRPPCEVIIRTVLPLIRGLIAIKLYNEGLSQKEIAKLLGTTQAAVNGYVKHSEMYYVKKLSKIGVPIDMINFIVKTLLPKVKRGEVISSLTTLCNICKSFKSKGYICDLHASQYPELRECNMCLKVEEEELVEVEVLDSMKAAIVMLERSHSFPHVIPEVNSNLVMAKRSAVSIRDVAGVPGRIVKVLGKAKAVSQPRFGASQHMARVLLSAMSVDPYVRAAINIKYDDKVRRAIEMLGLKYVIVQERPRSYHITEDDVVNDIKALLKRLKYVPDVVIDCGGLGVEPIAYIFGIDAIDVAQKAISIASAYTTLNKY